MKRIIVIALCVMIVMLTACSGSSDKPHGKYYDNIGFSTLEFKGEKVTFESLQDSASGTYTMDGNTVNIVYDNGSKDSYVYDKEKDTLDLFGQGLVIFSKEKK